MLYITHIYLSIDCIEIQVLFDIVGFMWLWKISINSISIVNLVLAIGLAVDYSAHVAHAFMHATGTRDERMIQVCVCVCRYIQSERARARERASERANSVTKRERRGREACFEIC